VVRGQTAPHSGQSDFIRPPSFHLERGRPPFHPPVPQAACGNRARFHTIGGAWMTAPRSKRGTARRLKRGEPLKVLTIDFDDEEWAIVEARAAAAGLTVDEYAVMCVIR